jgi:hypothetical protein
MSKIVKTGVNGTVSGGELYVRLDSLGNEVGIIDTKRDVAIYWAKVDTDKIVNKLKEVVK